MKEFCMIINAPDFVDIAKLYKDLEVALSKNECVGRFL